MRIGLLRRTGCAALGLLLASCAATPVALPAPPPHANGQTLWRIVSGRCIPGQIASGDPAPCTEVSIADGVARGHVVLKDRVGTGQYLVMPTSLIAGIEDSRLLRANAPDYFTPAWQARRLVAARFGMPLAREDIGIAVNSRYGRSQDLLHLHVDCLRRDVRDDLRRAMPRIDRRWSRRLLVLAGHRYHAVRIDGDDRVGANPFLLLSRGLHVRPGDMGAWTIVLAGADFAGHPGFVLLAARADPANGYDGSGEQLQDHECAGRGTMPLGFAK